MTQESRNIFKKWTRKFRTFFKEKQEEDKTKEISYLKKKSKTEMTQENGKGTTNTRALFRATGQ
jgi:hypothetical protein